MLTYLTKDITTVDCGIIAHGVNNTPNGAMRAGVALHLRKKYPQIFHEYSRLCIGDNETRDKLLGTTNFVIINPKVIVANCFTQRLGIREGKGFAIPGAIADSLSKCYELATLLQLPLYLPKIGCGLGGLSYEDDVKTIIESLTGAHSAVDTFICDL